MLDRQDFIAFDEIDKYGPQTVSGTYDFTPAANAAATIASLVLRGDLIRARTFLNLNVPPGKPKGFRLTVQAKRNRTSNLSMCCAGPDCFGIMKVFSLRQLACR